VCVPGQPRPPAASSDGVPPGYLPPGVAPPGVAPPGVVPSSAAEAAAMSQAGLAWLARADATGLTAAEQADCLRALERAESALTAARSSVLAGFDMACAFQDDGVRHEAPVLTGPG